MTDYKQAAADIRFFFSLLRMGKTAQPPEAAFDAVLALAEAAVSGEDERERCERALQEEHEVLLADLEAARRRNVDLREALSILVEERAELEATIARVHELPAKWRTTEDTGRWESAEHSGYTCADELERALEGT